MFHFRGHFTSSHLFPGDSSKHDKPPSLIINLVSCPTFEATTNVSNFSCCWYDSYTESRQTSAPRKRRPPVWFLPLNAVVRSFQTEGELAIFLCSAYFHWDVKRGNHGNQSLQYLLANICQLQGDGTTREPPWYVDEALCINDVKSKEDDYEEDVKTRKMLRTQKDNSMTIRCRWKTM